MAEEPDKDEEEGAGPILPIDGEVAGAAASGEGAVGDVERDGADSAASASIPAGQLPMDGEHLEAPTPTLDPPLVLAPPPEPPPKPAKSARKPGAVGRFLRRAVLVLLIVGVALPVFSTIVYRFVPPPLTILMVQRLFEGKGLDRRWVSLSKMSPALPRAVIAAEDARFCGHYGFDLQAIEKAMRNNERRPTRIRGGSTISQQTAKNVFLWPQRSWVRKGLEAYFTVLIETIWGKRRIMEVYLNTAEWGPGIYGADAAARRYFGVGADRVTPTQAARLAAILPSPLKWKAAKPGRYVAKRSRKIGAASGTVRREGLEGCLR